MNKIIPILATILLILFSCSSEPKNKHQKPSTEELNQIKSVALLSNEKGMKMLSVHCYSCHNPNSVSHDNMLAPPLAGIKYKYRQNYQNREEFVYKMSEFIIKPTKGNAVMKGPVRRFGLMPKTTITSEQEVYQLVSFIYDTPMEYPTWFPKHFEEQHAKPWTNQ